MVLVRKKEEKIDKDFLPAEAGSRAKLSKSSSHRQQAGYGDMGEIKAVSAANLCQSGGIYKRKGHLVIKIRGLGRKFLRLSVCKAISTQSGIGICCS